MYRSTYLNSIINLNIHFVSFQGQADKSGYSDFDNVSRATSAFVIYCKLQFITFAKHGTT